MADSPRRAVAQRRGWGTGSALSALMMLSTETLYYLQRGRSASHWGRRGSGCRHVYTGIVGPFLVVLHSGGRFRGWLAC